MFKKTAVAVTVSMCLVSGTTYASNGEALTLANQIRTRQQVLAGGDAEVNAQIEAEATAKAAAAAREGEALTKANQMRTRQQVLAGGAAEVHAQMQAEAAAKAAAAGQALTEANQLRTSEQITAGTLAAENAQLQAQAALVASPTPHLDSPDVDAERAEAMKQAILQHREVLAHDARFAGMNSQPAINVAATTLNPDTPVSVTVNGIEQTTTAGVLAQFDPQVQVSVPQVSSYFQKKAVRGGQNQGERSASIHGGTGNGSNNAANSASGHGLGGGDHIGGGSAQNGGFHGSW